MSEDNIKKTSTVKITQVTNQQNKPLPPLRQTKVGQRFVAQDNEHTKTPLLKVQNRAVQQKPVAQGKKAVKLPPHKPQTGAEQEFVAGMDKNFRANQSKELIRRQGSLARPSNQLNGFNGIGINFKTNGTNRKGTIIKPSQVLKSIKSNRADRPQALKTIKSELSSQQDDSQSFTEENEFIIDLQLSVKKEESEKTTQLSTEEEESEKTTQLSPQQDETTTLFDAVKNDDLNMVQRLLEQGAKPNEIGEDKGRTPIFYTTDIENLKIIDLLLGYGADLKKQDKQGMTPLHHIALYGKPEVLEYLLGKEGVNPNILNTKNETPLMYALRNEKDPKKSVEILIEHKANPSVRSIYGRTALYEAISKKNYEIIEFLLSKGADTDVELFCGLRTLHIAACNNDTKSVQILLKFGADINKLNTEGLTPDQLTDDEEIKQIIETEREKRKLENQERLNRSLSEAGNEIQTASQDIAPNFPQ